MSRYTVPKLTSYDLLKSLALLLMILDHVGFFFYPENEWFRVVGRASMPIWLFLIGYARSRDLSKPIWIAAGLLALAPFILGGSLLPLNILVTIIICRLVLDFAARIIFHDWERMCYGGFIIAILMICTFMFFEYGTAALLIALSGYLARHRYEVNLSETVQKSFMAFSGIFYILTQLLIFHEMGHAQRQVMAVAIGAVCLLLYKFVPREMPEVESKLPAFVSSALEFGGRYTLEIYVFQMILFKLLFCLHAPAAQGFFAWHLLP